MQVTQKLTRALRDLVALVEEEASRNPAFAARVEQITAELPSVPSSPSRKNKARGKVGPLPDVMAVYQAKGENEFRFWLREFDMGMLKAIVKANGFDPTKNSQRWVGPDKFIDLIVDQTGARLRRGSSFLPPKASEGPPSPPAP
jgi:hypothetical protein